MIAEIRGVLVTPRTFFERLPQSAQPSFPRKIAFLTCLAELGAMLARAAVLGESVKDMGYLLAIFLPVGLLLMALAPVLLLVAWAPIRLFAGPEAQPWAIAGATFVPDLLLTPLDLVYFAIPTGTFSLFFYWSLQASAYLWPTALVFLGSRTRVPSKAVSTSIAFLGAQASIAFVLSVVAT